MFYLYSEDIEMEDGTFAGLKLRLEYYQKYINGRHLAIYDEDHNLVYEVRNGKTTLGD